MKYNYADFTKVVFGIFVTAGYARYPSTLRGSCHTLFSILSCPLMAKGRNKDPQSLVGRIKSIGTFMRCRSSRTGSRGCCRGAAAADVVRGGTAAVELTNGRTLAATSPGAG